MFTERKINAYWEASYLIAFDRTLFLLNYPPKRNKTKKPCAQVSKIAIYQATHQHYISLKLQSKMEMKSFQFLLEHVSNVNLYSTYPPIAMD